MKALHSDPLVRAMFPEVAAARARTARMLKETRKTNKPLARLIRLHLRKARATLATELEQMLTP